MADVNNTPVKLAEQFDNAQSPDDVKNAINGLGEVMKDMPAEDALKLIREVSGAEQKNKGLDVGLVEEDGQQYLDFTTREPHLLEGVEIKLNGSPSEESFIPDEASGDAKGAIGAMDRRMDNEKLNLSIGQIEDVKAIEKAVVEGNDKELSAVLQKYEGDPKSAETVMNTVAKDLSAVGIDARWDYGTKQAGSSSEDNFVNGREDFGHLTLATDKGDGTFTRVRFSTSGQSEGINMPIPAVDGSASSKNPSPVHPSEGLRFIRDKAINQ